MGAPVHPPLPVAVNRACEKKDTKALARLMPGADAVGTALLPAVAQFENQPKLLMLEDCPHWMWWDKKKELLADYEPASLGQDARSARGQGLEIA